ncbi:hypothetical protein BDSB_09310 [Burkholderia dolosa PC543]|nr:hypothetical protein BDSB_09310 [Burkholderia dolosa PC543]
MLHVIAPMCHASVARKRLLPAFIRLTTYAAVIGRSNLLRREIRGTRTIGVPLPVERYIKPFAIGRRRHVVGSAAYPASAEVTTGRHGDRCRNRHRRCERRDAKTQHPVRHDDRTDDRDDDTRSGDAFSFP